MIFQINAIVDWEKIKTQERLRTQEFNVRENENRLVHEYKIGDKVLVYAGFTEVKRELNKPIEGPYTITKIYKNGNIQIDKGAYEEVISIRRVKLFKE